MICRKINRLEQSEESLCEVWSSPIILSRDCTYLQSRWFLVNTRLSTSAVVFAVILLKTMDKNYNNPPRRSDTFDVHQLALMSILSKYGEWIEESN